MFKKVLRELYMLPRGEQRALVILSIFLIVSLVIRIAVQMLPAGKPPGMKQFVRESREVMAALARMDSLNQTNKTLLPGRENREARSASGPNSSAISRRPGSIPSININTVDSAGLLPLPGIGPVLAGRIIKYRSLLGGYWHWEQLSEVYGLNRETARRVGPFIRVDPADLKMLEMNSAGFGELLRHPYLGYEEVKALLNYREIQDSIHALEEIRENNLLPDSTLRKIGPYLDFNH